MYPTGISNNEVLPIIKPKSNEVLIVDDNDFNIFSLQNILEEIFSI